MFSLVYIFPMALTLLLVAAGIGKAFHAVLKRNNNEVMIDIRD